MWHYKFVGRGAERVAEGLFKPLAAEWASFTEFIAGADTVVSVGRFIGVNGIGTTGKSVEARYAHVWTVKAGKVATFRQYIDTLAVAEAREP
jgi:ketosteroid isomerase-like protein